MKNKKGFTLIELLVVISIIALLLSILMPSLGRAKEIAKGVVCQAHLKQWGTIIFLYTMDNDDSFMTGQTVVGSSSEQRENSWMELLRSYYGDNDDFRVCTKAKKTKNEGGKEPFVAWDDFGGYWVVPKGDFGSYGINWWINNPHKSFPGVISGSPYPTKYFWRKVAKVTRANNVPMFLDCGYFLARPRHDYDKPPRYDGDIYLDYGISRFCTSRHNDRTNGVFVDGSVRWIDLKELWTLKWSKGYKTSNEFTKAGGLTGVWPDWMEKMKDY